MLFIPNGPALGYISTGGGLLAGTGGPGGVIGPGVTTGTGFLPGSSSLLPGGTGAGTGGQISGKTTHIKYEKINNLAPGCQTHVI